jgi:hypothetical protein
MRVLPFATGGFLAAVTRDLELKYRIESFSHKEHEERKERLIKIRIAGIR